ncbi:hypothetical protein C7974DRAFT_383794 [Boeremia exigua]|uniref:uncharacterized protein n=1 Tax=Boeremia exigua TaxID=749465 RepID=UPI001E8E90FE|nr:uncharacterized protein C7974DRAFT_383794 [Boeremia exigua]KAH6644554.1 hypothetical protein C7974DRAFT_383794 [Boeremia exigua]
MATFCTANESIRNRLEGEPGSKWGFVIFRCTYKSDDKWRLFMEYFKTMVQAKLAREELSDCFSHLDWSVQEDPGYEGMQIDEIRTKFQQWIASGAERDDGSARFMACLRVDEIDVDSVVQIDQPPETGDPRGWMSLDLVSIHEEEDFVSVGIGYLLPRAYLLIEDPGWWVVYREDGDVSLP